MGTRVIASAQKVARLQRYANAVHHSKSDAYTQPTPHRRLPDRVASVGSSTRVESSFITQKAAPKYPPKALRNSSISGNAERTRSGSLRENHVAIRVKELCTTGQLDEAIVYCTNVPTAVQGPVAWNIIIQSALDAKRYNLAYSQFLAMKKRAVKPTVSTYLTFLKGYAQADSVNLTPLQLERAEKIYKDLSHLVSSNAASNDKHANVLHPAAAYADVLTNAGAYQKIWDVFYDLDEHGPLAPNEHVFTSMFLALGKRAKAEGAPPVDGRGSRAAGAATLLWRQVLRATERQPFPIDSHLVTAALRALQHGGETEHQLAYSIIKDYLGLQLPDPASGHQHRSQVPLDHRALDAALAVCASSGRPDLIKHYLDAVTHSKDPRRRQAVTTFSMDRLLAHYASSADARQAQETIDWMLREAAIPNGLGVKPTSNSWSLAFRACANAKDWAITDSLLDRLASTRYDFDETKDWTVPSAEAVYFILKAAHISQDTDKQRYKKQLRKGFSVVQFMSRLWTKPSDRPRPFDKLDAREQRRAVFQNKLVELVEAIMGEHEDLRNREAMIMYRRITQMQVELPTEVRQDWDSD